MKTLNKKFVKSMSVIMAVVLACGGTGILAYAAGAKNGGGTEEDAAPAVSVSTASGAESGAAADAVNSKDETVYVLADADGSVKKIIVSDWIKNAAGSAAIQDVTVP
jgi:putative membrane protein